MFDRQQTVASVVLDHSECASIFQQHRIDFCCRGELTIEAAAKEKGVDVDALVEALSRAIANRSGSLESDARELSTPDLIAHIVTKHHDYLRQALPFVETMAKKVGRVHGEHNPKLPVLRDAVSELVNSLLPHLDEEEQSLFPELSTEQVGPTRGQEIFAAMQVDHLAVKDILERIREQSDDFTLPDWACNSYRTLFSELEKLEGDVFTHVHLENHVLAPRFS